VSCCVQLGAGAKCVCQRTQAAACALNPVSMIKCTLQPKNLLVLCNCVQEQNAFAGAHKLLPVLGSIWDVRKLQDVWDLLHVVLLDHAYAAAPEK